MASTAILVDPYVLASLMPDLVGHDRAPSAYLLYLGLWRLAGAPSSWTVAISLQQLATQTGLSKTAVQRAVVHLRRRQLISTTRQSATVAPRYTVLTPWRQRGAP